MTDRQDHHHEHALAHTHEGPTPCWASRLRDRMRRHGLRPTRQRVHLATMLFTRGNRHVTAEEIHAEALDEGVSVSLATVYNTLHQFTEAGLLRVLSIETNKTYFDTDVSDHHHFLADGGARVFDIPEGSIKVGELPTPPEGYEIEHVDVVIRLRRKTGTGPA